MAKKDELEFEGGIENAPKPNNSEKLKALQAAMGGPTRMSNSHATGHILPFGCPFQISYFSHGFIHIQLMSVVMSVS